MTLVEHLARIIDRLPRGRVLVAFDGPDAAGKTTLARATAGRLVRPALCASVDGWHNQRTVRHRRGEESPEGYYLDSIDLDALVRDFLAPFREGASEVQPVHFDYRHDEAAGQTRQVAPDTALLFDGVFLLRPELLGMWDLRVYLHVPESVTLTRVVVRDRQEFGDEATVRRRYQRRYLPGQAMYRDAASPLEVADIVIDNSDWLAPLVLRWTDHERCVSTE